MLTLQQLCIAKCVSDLDFLLKFGRGADRFLLELPTEICNNLFEYYYRVNFRHRCDFLSIFNDSLTTRLSRVIIKSLPSRRWKFPHIDVDPWMLDIVCKHPLTHIEIPINRVQNVPPDNNFDLYNLFKPLQNVRNSLKILVLNVSFDKDFRRNIMEKWIRCCADESESESLMPLDLTFEFPNLTSLKLKNFYFNVVDAEFTDEPDREITEEDKKDTMQKFFNKVQIFRNVSHLDLTGCYMHSDCYAFLENCPHLTSLVMADVHDNLMDEHDEQDEGFMKMMATIVKLKQLR